MGGGARLGGEVAIVDGKAVYDQRSAELTIERVGAGGGHVPMALII